MQELWKVVILAIVQGVTEFLPISSDGHLVLASLILGVPIENDPRLHDLFVVLHFGTLLSIVVVYLRRLFLLLRQHRHLLWPLFVGSLPAGIAGLVIKKGIPDEVAGVILLHPVVTGVGFITTGVVLLIGGCAKRGEADYVEIKPLQAFWIGCAQALAILPGVSRSGMTISTGLKLGLSPISAASFSFLLGVPIIFAATMVEVVDTLRSASPASENVEAAVRMSPLYLAVGVVVSFLVGLASLMLLIRLLERGRFQWFAAWCIPLGVGLLVYEAIRLAL